ncbi:hypothetical protein GM418_16390 [Maribellus comscasis]|uniref:Cysteine dioxygenase n=1 Tax=Maribellus comscasis TaxID=2681766 RepID=A0A6I6K5A8_9BACT|nr:cysteine dioxygenase family protein [Maribellus comscasis]QGY45194.1 hypothetical protein GM418_16390 [Maribellus comscasis]
MKDLFNTTANKQKARNGHTNLHYFVNKSERFNRVLNYQEDKYNTDYNVIRENLLTHDAYLQMAAGLIPDLWNICRDLYNTFFENHTVYSALQFIPVMQQINSFKKDQLQRFLKNRETRHVLVNNDFLKVVLIHWKPGKVSPIHGHPQGGCMFKVLHGKLEELRYTADESQRLLSSNGYRTGSMAYIDDRLGFHAVGNPFGSSAVSLHAYTPGS